MMRKDGGILQWYSTIIILYYTGRKIEIFFRDNFFLLSIIFIYTKQHVSPNFFDFVFSRTIYAVTSVSRNISFR